MHRSILTLALVALAGVAVAQTTGSSAYQTLGQQLMANPQLQQAIAGQMVQGAMANNAGNPAGGFASMNASDATALAGQAQAIANKYLTAGEQAKLTAFQSSPEGQAIIAKLPQMANELAPLLLQAYLGNAAVAPAAGSAPKLPLTQPTGAQ